MIVVCAFDIEVTFITNISLILGQGEVKEEEYDSQMQNPEL